MKYHFRRRIIDHTQTFTNIKLLIVTGAAFIIIFSGYAGSQVLGRFSGHSWFKSHSKAKVANLNFHQADHYKKINQGQTNSGTAMSSSGTSNGGATTSQSPGSTGTPPNGITTGQLPGGMIGNAPALPGAGSGTIITTVYTTAYTFFDNTPAGSADIAFPHSSYPATIHEKAGGTGTYNDPLTLAVGHVITNGRSTPDFAPGTRFYFPDVRKYAIVEDLCGDGGSPQNIPCHNVSTAPRGTTLWLDLWIGGSASDSRTTVQNCASTVTDSTGELHTVVKDPSPNYAVSSGPVFQNGYCIQPSNKGFGNSLVTL